MQKYPFNFSVWTHFKIPKSSRSISYNTTDSLYFYLALQANSQVILPLVFLSFFHDYGHAVENPPELVLATLTFYAFSQPL